MSLFSVALALMLVGCGPRETASSAEAADGTDSASVETLPVMGSAPAWQLTRLDGTTLSSEELKGKVVVVDFWATWCGPCIQEIPGYVAMQEKYADRGLMIVGVSVDHAGVPVVEEFARKHAINYPIVMGDGDVAEAFGGVQAIPTTFLIDREGQIRHRKLGAMARENYEPLIQSLL